MIGLAGKLLATAASTASQISFIGAASAAGTNTLTLPAYQPGDLLVVFAYNNSTSTIPTRPSGWTAYRSGSNGTSQIAYVTAWRVATGSDPVGTWTNATDIVVHVYRGAKATTPLGAFAAISTSGASSSLGYPAVTGSAASSWFVAFAGASGSTGYTIATPPTNMVNRTSAVGGANSCVGHDTNGSRISFPANSVSTNQTVYSYTVVIEIISA